MSERRQRRSRPAVSMISALAVAIGIAATAFAVTAAESSGTPAPPASSTTYLKPARPYWIELLPAQRQALAPLADDWERLDGQTKKKWVEIGNRYPRMNPDEQARTQQRMREWALLTPDQRRVARDSYARVRSMNPEQRADMLRKYQELPQERKQALTTQGQASKGLVVPKAVSSSPVARRVEIREGAKVKNPALAAQKGANPIVAPAVRPVRKPEPVPAAAPATVPMADLSTVAPTAPAQSATIVRP